MLQGIPIVESGIWAEVEAGGQHLRLFAVETMLGLKFLDDLHHNAVHQFKNWRTALAPPMPTSVDTGTVVVDKSNLKVYQEALAEHPKPL